MWLALNNLLVDPGCRGKVLQNGSLLSASGALVRLRKRMSDVLLDQLPVLIDLQRVLDELAMGCVGMPNAATTPGILEQARRLLGPSAYR